MKSRARTRQSRARADVGKYSENGICYTIRDYVNMNANIIQINCVTNSYHTRKYSQNLIIRNRPRAGRAKTLKRGDCWVTVGSNAAQMST